MSDKLTKLKKVLEKAANIEGSTPIALATEFVAMEEKIEALATPSWFIDENKIVDAVLSKVEIPKPIKGDKGDTYTLTDKDKKEIAKTIKVPVVEKEIVHEQPVITNEIVEVAKYETPDEIKIKLETLKGNNRIDVSAIKGIDTKKLSDEIVNRAIGIVDQRTSFLINKVSNLKAQVDNLPSSSGGYTKETPTGLVDGSNTSFTVTSEPVYVIADGITYFDGAGYTYLALAITMDNAPQQYIRSFF